MTSHHPFMPLAAAAVTVALATAGTMAGLHAASAASPATTSTTMAGPASLGTAPASATTVAAPLTGRPPASLSVQAPPSPTSSRVFAAVAHAFTTMTKTTYQHHDVENGAAGTYYFDCVGLANYFLSLGAPQALAALRAAEKVPAEDVPSPDHFADYLSQLPARGTSLWSVDRTVAQIQPGDLIVMRKVTRLVPRPFVGHAMIAASAPFLLSNGSYALNVFDSTGAPLHGTGDSRHWDPRTMGSGRNGPGSGLGMGTVQLWVSKTGAPERISWWVGATPVPTPIVIARALH